MQQLAARNARPLVVFVTGVVTAITVACAPVRTSETTAVSPSSGLPVLSFLSEFTRPAGTNYPQLSDSGRFGSLSGLAFDEASGDWLAVVDDRVASRVAWLAITAEGGRLDVTPRRMQALRAGPGVDPRVVTQADLEAIVVLPDGTFLMSEEGHVTKEGVWPPAILRATRDGVVTEVIAYPPEFQVSTDGKTGIRDNQGFEALTRTPRGRLIAGLEQAPIDRPVTSFERGGESRLIEFEPAGATFRPGRQWRYELSPTPRSERIPDVCSDGENGLVELLALTETLLIALERACLMTADRSAVFNPIQVFAVDISGETATKTLLLDLSTVIPSLSPAMAGLDNFEGLAFGPPVNGARTLLLMSDDNFRKTQFTSFLLFRMGSVPEPVVPRGLTPSR